MELLGTRGQKRRRWCRARCVCGKEQEIKARSLRSSESCGCLKRPQVGEVFGVRTVVSSNPGVIRVRCICGKEWETTSRYFLRTTYSCGCAKPPPDAEGPRQARIEQRIRRTDPKQYLLDIVRKRRAVRDGRLECTIKPEDFQVPLVCPERGVPLQSGDGQKTADSPTVVRLDLDLGYVPGNIRIVSWKAAGELNRQQLAEKRAAILAAAERAEQEAEAQAEAARKVEQKVQNAKRRERWIERLERWVKELERPVYDKEVSTLPCSVRLERALQQLGVRTVLDLLALEPKHFHEQRNVGRTSVRELERHMKGLGVLWPNPAAVWLLNKDSLG